MRRLSKFELNDESLTVTDKQMKTLYTLAFVLIAFIISAGVGIIPLPSKVKQGETLVIAHNLGSQRGEVEESKSGITWTRHYFVDTYKMPNSIREDKYDSFEIVSKDNQRLPVGLILQYRVNSAPGCGSAIYKDYRKDIDEIIKTDLFSSTKDLAFRTFSKYNADEIFGGKIDVIADSMTTKAQTGALVDSRNNDGDLCILINQVKISDVDADDAIKRAVSQKIVRDQEVQEEIANTRKVAETLKQDSLRAVIVALNNNKIQESLTPQVLEKMKLENQAAFVQKWDGKLSTYSMTSGVPFFMNVD